MGKNFCFFLGAMMHKKGYHPFRVMPPRHCDAAPTRHCGLDPIAIKLRSYVALKEQNHQDRATPYWRTYTRNDSKP